VAEFLLHTRGRLGPEKTKTVTALAFEVPDGTSGIALRFDYQPRRCEDPAVCRPLVESAFRQHAQLRIARGEASESEMLAALDIERRSEGLDNLLNVVLIDPQGRWRGRWDRSPSGSEGELYLSAESASRGFLAGEITAGTWQAAVECHGVFGEAVSYELEVVSVERSVHIESGEAAAGAASGARVSATGPGWRLGELHSHSLHSDGAHEVAELAAIVAETGADFLALTDHNTMSGHDERGELPLTLVRGCELTTFHGHHPIYGMSEMVPWHIDGEVRTLEEMAPEIRSLGGLVGIAHPFVPGDPLCTGCRMRSDLSPQSFDMVEVWYRRWASPGADNPAAYAYWNRLWQDGARPIGVAARDWHRPDQAQPFPGDFPFSAVWSQSGSANAILAGLRAGAVVMTGGPLLDIEWLAADDRSCARIGGTVSSGLGVRLRVGAARVEGASELRVLRNGEVAHSTALTGDDVIDFGPALEAPGWYRCELWMGAMPRAISNHIVVE